MTSQVTCSLFVAIQTDGADTVYADNITFRNWIVDNGDDSISMKANSTNILIENCDFYTGLGLAIGSIGQYGTCYEMFFLSPTTHLSSNPHPWCIGSGLLPILVGVTW